MSDLDIVGGAAVDVVPIVPNFHTKLKALVLPIADKVGEEAGKRMGQAISDNIVIAIPSAINKGGKAAQGAAAKQGSDTGGAFARSIRAHLEAAFKAMPKLDIRLSDAGVDAELARIRAKLEQLAGKRIGIDVDAVHAAAEVERLDEQLRRLGAAHPNIAVRADTATARAALAKIREEVAALTAEPGRVRLETDGAFGAKLRAVVEQAKAGLPEINIDADTSPARAEIQSLRAQLAALADARVGIDVDAGEALAKINEIQARLAVLSLKSADIDVRVDAARASAQLAALQAQADGTKTFKITALADTSQASSALLALSIQMAVLAAIPAIPVGLAGLGAIASMATAAAGGVGALALVAVPAIHDITAALQAKSAAEKDATATSAAGSSAGIQAAQRALQMAGAQQALAAAHRSAAQSITQANRAIADAERALADAQQRAADQRRSSAEAVARAEQALSDARRQSADSVARAERSLADAQRDARLAEEALTAARRTAAQQLQDLSDRLKDGQLDQREATLRVKQAQEDLQRVMADPTATDLQREQAQLAFDQAKQHADEQVRDYKRLQVEAARQRAAGIGGNDAVRAAAKRLADAQRDVGDQTKAVADAQRAAARAVSDALKGLVDAQRDAARQQRESARSVADAQRRVGDAVQAAANAQVSAADSIAAAERGVESARLSGLGTTAKAISKTDEYQKALAKLTPEGRKLFEAIAGPQGLRVAFREWSTSLQPEVLPLFTRGVDGAKASLPGFTPLVLGAAAGVRELMDRASAQLKTPFWQGFKKDLADNVKPAVVGFGVAFGNVIKGVAGVIDAFLPHMDGIAAHSDRITARFARWGTSLKGSPDFERFLAYVKETSPGLAEFLGDLFRAALDVSKALSPLSSTMFATLEPVLKAISWISVHAPGLVQALWGIYFAQKAIALGMAAFAGAMVLYETVVAGATLVTAGWAVAINATGIIPVLRAIILVVGLVVVGVIYAYNHWGIFHDAVDAAARGIGTVASGMWAILKPIFDGIVWAVMHIGDGLTWLWQTIISPVFGMIASAAQILFTAVVTLALLPIYLAVQTLGGIFSWLWEKAIHPAINEIAAAARWLWDKVIDPFFSLIGGKAQWLYNQAIAPASSHVVGALQAIGDGARWLWDRAIGPIFGWIGDKADWLYTHGIKPPFNKIMSGIHAVADSFATARDDIKKAWDQVADIAKKPVRFIIDHVYNHGIVPLWSAVAKITGAKKLDKIDLEGFATGGVMSGYSPGRDDRIIAVGGGEAVMRPEWTRAVGPGYVHTMNAAARSGGVSGVQKALGIKGYFLGGIVDWFKDKGSDVGNFFKTGWDYLTNPGKAFDVAKDWIKNQLKDIGAGQWGVELAKMPITMVSDLKDKALEWVGLGGGGGGPTGSGDGGSGVARWRPTVLQALDLLGQPGTWADTVLRRMNQESGGNPRAVNLWDSNAKAGYPSTGLMQVIRPTFQSYAGKFQDTGPFMYGVSVDPLANTYAGLNYAVHRYHSLSALNRPGGYAEGGFPGVGELAWVGEQGPELVRFMHPAQVYSHSDSSRIAANWGGVQSGGGRGDIHADVRVFVGDREITDIVRTEVVAHENRTSADITTGRW
ncbi:MULTISPECIES: transglycosylase SLT domain-containing protein [unclassified Streptomyces]|uniref:transglycosylase SLT domain-containing protein n=1 Tax=unclassified Streptomyces TaxID=2593676 RepID=UPI00340E197B